MKKAGPTDHVSYTYNRNGTRESMVDATGTTLYFYNPVGQLSNITYPEGRNISYEFDDRGNRTHEIPVFRTAQLYVR